MSNGRVWAELPQAMKITYLRAVFDARNLFTWVVAANGISNSGLDGALRDMSVNLTNPEVSNQLDMFYADASNAPVPVVMALKWVCARHKVMAAPDQKRSQPPFGETGGPVALSSARIFSQ